MRSWVARPSRPDDEPTKTMRCVAHRPRRFRDREMRDRAWPSSSLEERTPAARNQAGMMLGDESVDDLAKPGLRPLMIAGSLLV